MIRKRITKATAVPGAVTALALLLLSACGTDSGSGSGSGSESGTGSGARNVSGAAEGAGADADGDADGDGKGDAVPALTEVLRNTKGTNGATGTVWEMASVTVGGKKITPTEKARANLRVDADGTFRLSPDCNLGTQKVTVDGGILVVSDEPGDTTLMSCPDEQRPFADAFGKVFRGKLSTTLGDDGRLTLTGAGDDSIALTLDRPAPLVGTDWRVDGVVDTVIEPGDTQGSLPKGTDGKASLTFGKGADGKSGTVEGTDGCNVFRGSAKISEATNKITFGALRTTKKACSQPESALEERFAKVLTGEIEYELGHNQLKLLAGNGLGISAKTTPKTTVTTTLQE
ncbi:META domain-containing protein [Streptomyces sp. NPDC093109]|uniref:META domain-containing protein n=1 Tax=Streptomyces sp. NPDC093109 TaxID=3154977 RepID=UPI00344C28DD